jgi:Putative zincin peptidase
MKIGVVIDYWLLKGRMIKMERTYIGKISNGVLLLTLYWISMFLLLKIFWVDSFIWAFIYAVVLGVIVPYVHECCHVVAYKMIHSDTTISIHLGKGMWFVLDESEYQYTKGQMILVLISPILVSIIPSVLLFMFPPLQFLWFLCFLASMMNLLGMGLLNLQKQKGDFQYILEIIRDQKHTEYKFLRNAKLQKIYPNKETK